MKAETEIYHSLVHNLDNVSTTVTKP